MDRKTLDRVAALRAEWHRNAENLIDEPVTEDEHAAGRAVKEIEEALAELVRVRGAEWYLLPSGYRSSPWPQARLLEVARRAFPTLPDWRLEGKIDDAMLRINDEVRLLKAEAGGDVTSVKAEAVAAWLDADNDGRWCGADLLEPVEVVAQRIEGGA